jgi:pimeloyl-ACP methyl ester carboxylesterase
MPYAELEHARIYYELTGPEHGPLVLQFGGSLFGRANFDAVNDGFRERFRLLSFDATGYGRSSAPIEDYTIEGWADEGAQLLDALGVERVLTHGTSMGGMIAIAFTARYPERTIASCADCAFARCDVYRRTMFRNWRHLAEAMPLDELSDLVTIQAVSATFIEANPGIFETVRSVINKNSPYTVRQACLAMETMDLEPLVRRIRRPILFTNGSRDVMTPPDLAPSGFSARQIVAAVPEWARLYEFPEIGHADLLEAPDEAVRVVSAFFDEVLERERVEAAVAATAHRA